MPYMLHTPLPYDQVPYITYHIQFVSYAIVIVEIFKDKINNRVAIVHGG